MKIALLIVSVLVMSSILAVGSFSPAMAHSELVQGDINIVAGWVNEPPVVGQINGIELTITRVSDGQPVSNAMAQLDVNIRKGTPTKSLSFRPTEEVGVYVADILPTQTGQYAVVLRGTVAGQVIDGQIEIEDVGDTAALAFPPATDGGISEEVLAQLQTLITDLSARVDEADTSAEEARTAAARATEASADLRMAADRAYLFGMVGVGVGIAGIVIGVTALRREKI
ncbi:MAG TPA: hypothetical protein VNI77_00145 [Nitrososphaera sp.]|nr:hypothetical protein [Nitrososphaera sp.]